MKYFFSSQKSKSKTNTKLLTKLQQTNKQNKKTQNKAKFLPSLIIFCMKQINLLINQKKKFYFPSSLFEISFFSGSLFFCGSLFNISIFCGA